MDSMQSEESIELFRYLRTLVNKAEASLTPHPKFALVEAYWHIGRIIVEIEQQGQHRAEYGIHLIEILSEKLTNTFGKGYSLPNMWRFKQFFLAFPILSTNGIEFINLRDHLRAELSWSHYRILMQISNIPERTFYIQQAADEQWTVRFLQRMIKSKYYYLVGLEEKQLPYTEKKEPSAQGRSIRLSAVGGTPRTRLANIKKILLERYVGYAFVAQRHYVSVNGQDRWVELVFFHYIHNRFVLIQLTEHDPASIAQFKMVLDCYEKSHHHTMAKPPIGFLVNQQGKIKVLTTSHEVAIPQEEAMLLPREFQ